MKIRIVVCITAALLVLIGASVWEGAASIAPGGDLPDGGYYAATNSFPRNTVVDITNLETGKSIRVIVAAGLETPGLLAVLSREAAEIIGLRPRSIGRIRMTQPSDPVAFSRFTEGLSSNGDPDYDPRALVAADPRAAALVNEPYPGEEEPASPAGREVPPAALSETEPPFDTGYDGDEIVDIAGFYDPAAALSADEAPPEDEGIIREPDLAWVYEPETDEAAKTAEITEEWEPEETPETADAGEAADIEATEPPETNMPPGWEPETGLTIAEEPDVPEPQNETPGGGEYDYTLVPTEERPPEEYPDYTLPPEAEISSLPPAGSPEAAAGPATIDESLFVKPIEEAAAEPPYPEHPGDSGSSTASALFSVPVIHNLERGKYYLQLGAFSRSESAESELNRIEKTYPLTIQNGGSAEKPIYRILVGPVNLGESGALLQRFKSIGYRDAFVRSGS
jgi:cell division septation protein DedD